MENNEHTKVNGIFRQSFNDLVLVLSEPRSFFSNRIHSMSFNHALVFGLVITWVAKTLEWLTRFLKNESLSQNLLKVKDQLKQLPFWKDLPSDIWFQGEKSVGLFSDSVIEALQITIHPFQALLHFFMFGIIYWLGGMLLVPRTSPHYSRATVANFVKIISVASAANIVGAILSFLPLSLGSFFGYLYYVVIMVIGFSIYFKISGLRACALFVIPGIFMITFFSCLILGGIAFFTAIFAALTH